MSTFALRLVHSDVSNVEAMRDGDNTIVGHLLGVFVSLDTDRDSLINKAQLFQALQLVGLRPNESLMSRYLHAQAEDHGATSSAAAAVLAFKVSPSVFVKITMEELRERREEMWDDLDPLINFAVAPDGQSKIAEVRGLNDNEVAETISVAQLRHLMVEVEAPGKLSEEEWDSFLETTKDIIVDNQVPTTALKKILYNFDGDAA
jgi:hypothetical protein